MTVEEKKAKYDIIKRGAYADYVVINRHTSFQPFVACWAFDDETYSWGQGHYFDTEADALNHLYHKEMEVLQAVIEEYEQL